MGPQVTAAILIFMFHGKPNHQSGRVIKMFAHNFISYKAVKLSYVIYLWRCTKCRTKRQFKTRLGEHLGYIGNENSEEPSRLHFSLPGHNKHHLIGLGIEQVRSEDPFIIKAREHKYIQLFDSYRRGLNQEP